MSKRKQRKAASTVRPSPPHAPAQPRALARPLAALVLLAVLVYANALRNGFVLDDIPIIVENPLVRDLGNVGRIFETNYWSQGGTGAVGDSTLYRPLTVASYALDYSLWGPSAPAFHAVNVALHAAVTALVFVLAVQVLGSTAAAAAVAAIFAVHPVHTEAVTGIVGRAELLAALFFLSALLALRRRTDLDDAESSRPAVGRIALGALLYLLALFSKEVAVTLPAVLALDDWLHRDELPRNRGATTRLLVMRYGALAVAVLIYFTFRHNAVPGGSQIWPGFLGVSPLDRVLTASRVLLEYIALFVFPRTLLADYWKTDVPIAHSPAEPLVLLSLVAWIAIGVLLVRRRRDAALVLSVAWFFITIAPVSNVLFPIGVAKAERLLYLPSVGLCLVAGWAYARVESTVSSVRQWAPRVALAVIVAALAVRTFARNTDWRDNLSLATSQLAVSPSSPLMNDIAAGELVKQGELKRATDLLREAVRQAPDKALYQTHLGVALYSQGALDQAIEAYQAAMRLDPNDPGAHNNLGIAYLDKRRGPEAEAEFNAAIRINPAFVDARMNLGALYLGRGDANDAVAQFTAAVDADPGRPDAQNALGVAYFRLGQLDSAVARYNAALQLNPNFTLARENLARVDSARAASPKP